MGWNRAYAGKVARRPVLRKQNRGKGASHERQWIWRKPQPALGAPHAGGSGAGPPGAAPAPGPGGGRAAANVVAFRPDGATMTLGAAECAAARDTPDKEMPCDTCGSACCCWD